MMSDYRKKIGTKDKPLELKTPPGTSSYTMQVDEKPIRKKNFWRVQIRKVTRNYS